jgi:hypothetical protein
MSSETTSTFQTFSTVLSYKIILWGVERCIHHSKPVKMRNTRYILILYERTVENVWKVEVVSDDIARDNI